jgi:hypothetical protein
MWQPPGSSGQTTELLQLSVSSTIRVTGTVKIHRMAPRKPKHPGGAPAAFGTTRVNTIAVRVDDSMQTTLEAAAAAAGLPLARYCMVRLAELHKIPLADRIDPYQERLPIGA